MERTVHGEGATSPRRESPAGCRLEAALPGSGPPGEVVLTESVAAIVRRASSYLQHGIPVHLTGPPGVGKTTLALYLARQRGRPLLLLHGDASLTTAELVGAPLRFTRKLVVDEFVRSVYRREESLVEQWVANRLAVACRMGATLVYDEFTRSRPEAHSVLLPVLEERVLPLPTAHGETTLVEVHPDFRLILTSNPGETVGVFGVQQALWDRVLTLWLPGYGLDEMAGIVAARTGLAREVAAEIVRRIARRMRTRQGGLAVSLLRPALMVARVAAAEGFALEGEQTRLEELIADVVTGFALRTLVGREAHGDEAGASRMD